MTLQEEENMRKGRLQTSFITKMQESVLVKNRGRRLWGKSHYEEIENMISLLRELNLFFWFFQ